MKKRSSYPSEAPLYCRYWELCFLFTSGLVISCTSQIFQGKERQNQTPFFFSFLFKYIYILKREREKEHNMKFPINFLETRVDLGEFSEDRTHRLKADVNTE